MSEEEEEVTEKFILKFQIGYAGHPHWETLLTDEAYQSKEMGRAKVAQINVPGSAGAKELGCTCPEKENDFGAGYAEVPGAYVISQNCPLHTPIRPPEED